MTGTGADAAVSDGEHGYYVHSTTGEGHTPALSQTGLRDTGGA